MSLIYQRTESLLLLMLMHGSLTAAVLMVTPNVTGAALLTYASLVAAGTWTVIGFLYRRPLAAREGQGANPRRSPA